MQNPYLKCFLQNCKSNRGFSLIELMVVLVIVGILAIGVVFMFADPTAKVKAAAFEMRGDFNLARAEAVRRNDNILVQFVDSAQETCSKEKWETFKACFTGSLNGYVICFDENGDNDCETEVQATPPVTAAELAEVTADLEEKVIKTVLFKDSVRYYKFGATLPAAPSGPSTSPEGVALQTNDGITFSGTNDFIYMTPNGTSSDEGSVVIYLSAGDSDLIVRGKPYAVVVDSMSTGRVILERWHPEMGASGTWFRR